VQMLSIDSEDCGSKMGELMLYMMLKLMLIRLSLKDFDSCLILVIDVYMMLKLMLIRLSLEDFDSCLRLVIDGHHRPASIPVSSREIQH